MHERTRRRNCLDNTKKKENLGVDDEADIALTFKLALEYEGGFDFGTFCEAHLPCQGSRLHIMT
jgi:hypothetical protein